MLHFQSTQVFTLSSRHIVTFLSLVTVTLFASFLARSYFSYPGWSSFLVLPGYCSSVPTSVAEALQCWGVGICITYRQISQGTDLYPCWWLGKWKQGLTWQVPPFWQVLLGLQSSMFTSQFLPVHPRTQSHWWLFIKSWETQISILSYCLS